MNIWLLLPHLAEIRPVVLAYISGTKTTAQQCLIAKDEGISPDWWGNKFGFVSGGFLGARSRKRKSSISEDAQDFTKRTVFHEQDQENLYNLVQVCTPSVIIFCPVLHYLSYINQHIKRCIFSLLFGSNLVAPVCLL